MRGARAISDSSVTIRAAVRLLCCRRRPQFFWVSRQPPDTRRVGCEPTGAVFLSHFPSSRDGSERRSMRLHDNLVGRHRTGHASPEHPCGLGSALLDPLFCWAASLDRVSPAARPQAGFVGDTQLETQNSLQSKFRLEKPWLRCLPGRRSVNQISLS